MDLENLITGVQHLGIITGDVEKAAAWYQEKLGFRKIQQRVVPMNGRTEIAILSLGDLNLELIQPAGRLREEAKEKKDGKWDHYAIDAPDLENLAEEAKKKGLQFHSSTANGITEYEHLGEKGVRGVNYTGPSGEVIEFCHDNSREYGWKKGLQGWAHLALKVEDLDRSKAFYGRLGFRENGGGYLPTPEGRLRICFLEKACFVLEVIEMIGSGLEELRRRGDGHIDHIALEVSDIVSAMDAARKQKLPLKNYVIQELPLLDRGVKFFFIAGPDGEKVEFVEKM